MPATFWHNLIKLFNLNKISEILCVQYSLLNFVVRRQLFSCNDATLRTVILCAWYTDVNKCLITLRFN